MSEFDFIDDYAEPQANLETLLRMLQSQPSTVHL